MWKNLGKIINGEIAFGFFCAGIFWLAVLGFVTSFTPTTAEKEDCYQAAAKSGRDTGECKTFWEQTTSEPIALFTLVLAVANIGMWAATIGLYRGGRNQLQLARDEFLASHRPRLRLKHIWFSTPDGQRSSGFPQANTQLIVNLDIVNTGNSVAYLDHINAIATAIPDGQRLPQRPPYNEPGVPKIALNGSGLASGITFPQIVPLGGAITQQTIDKIRDGSERLYIVGTIAYWWGIDKPKARQTAFCRYLAFEWPPRADDNGRFEIEDDPNYEYQD
jgi:hypothetical protein